MKDKLKAAPWILGFMLCVNAGLLLITHRMSGNGWSLFLGFVLNVAVIAGASALLNRAAGPRRWIVLPAVLYAGFGLYYALHGGHLPDLLGVRETPPIPLKDVARFADHDVIHLTEGRVALSHALTRMSAGTPKHPTPIYDHVAPVVPDGWTSKDPVALWVADHGRSERPPASWKSELRAGRVIRGEAFYRAMIDGSSLATVPGAPLIAWSERPREEVETAARRELIALLAIDVLVFFVLLARDP